MENYSFKSKFSAEYEADAIRKKAIEIKNKRVSEKEKDSEPTKEDYEAGAEKIFSDYEAKKIEEWAVKIVESWHDDIKPDYIFLTETSATPAGYVLKETWQQAYPKENLPKFLRINPTASLVTGEKTIIGPGYERGDIRNKKEKINEEEANKFISEYISNTITKTNPRIIVFDEGSRAHGIGAIGKYSEDGKRINYPLLKFTGLKTDDIDNERAERMGVSYDELASAHTTSLLCTCGITAEFIFNALNKEGINPSIWTSRQSKQDEIPDRKDEGYGYYLLKGGIITIKKFGSSMPSPQEAKDITTFHQNKIDEDIVGVTPKDPEKRKEALRYISELKRIGKNAGKLLHQKIEEIN